MRDAAMVLALVLGLSLVARSLAEPSLAGPPEPGVSAPVTYYADHAAPLADCPSSRRSAPLAAHLAALR